MKKSFLFLAAFIFVSCAFIASVSAQSKLGKICGNPNVKCSTGNATFETYEIPFALPRNAVIYESESFYAIILKSVKQTPEVNCEDAISEDERLDIQAMFPNNKVFALKCSEAGNLYYTNVANNVNFIAVYAGRTLAEAKKFLKTVQSKGTFKGVNIRKIQAGFNGT